jgi:hypothetical protein
VSDIVIALGRKEENKMSSEIKLSLVKSRAGKDGRHFKAKIDTAKSKIYDIVEEM